MHLLPTFRMRSRFTLIEILVAIGIIAILLAMFVPMLYRSLHMARFNRWLVFNRQCANDPNCVINFNFQEGEGDILHNSCLGADVEGYDSKKYNGYLKKDGGGAHNFKWIKSGGRWGRFGYKNALQFNGVDTYITIPSTRGFDFTPEDDFTIMCWIKFDKLDFGDCPFSKSLWGTASDASAQFDMYYNPSVGSWGQGSFDVDVFKTCGSWTDTNINFERAGWVHLALTYNYTGKDASGDATGKMAAYINGSPLGDFIDATNENPLTCTASDWKACTEGGLNVPLIIGAAGCYRKHWDPGTYDPSKQGDLDNELKLKFFFQGKMDEFLVYKRSLSDSEILNHYLMGKE